MMLLEKCRVGAGGESILEKSGKLAKSETYKAPTSQAGGEEPFGVSEFITYGAPKQYPTHPYLVPYFP